MESTTDIIGPLNIENYYDVQAEVRNIEPDNRELEVLSSPGWTPNQTDLRQLQTALQDAQARAAQRQLGTPPGQCSINEGKQGKHIPGHNNYSPGRSYLTVHPNGLANEQGTGDPVNNIPRGQPGFKERIDFGRIIGYDIDPDTGVENLQLKASLCMTAKVPSTSSQ